MAGQTIILRSQRQRDDAHRLIDKAPDDYIVNIKEPTRNSEQNARMWAIISDVSRAKPEGRHWTTEVWKCAFMHALGWHCQFAEPLDGQGGPVVGPIHFDTLDDIGWVIAGGESGANRIADPDWYRIIRDQCAGARVPFHFKQWGDYDEHRQRRGKKNTGRVLDGVTHDGLPVRNVGGAA